VYLAHDEEMRRSVAVKVPSSELMGTARAVEEFRREARNASRLQHEGIVRAYDFDQEPDGQCYIVYEYIEGISLAQRIKPARLRQEPLPPEEAATIVAQVAEALHHAHLQREGLFHRDIKPANILLDGQGKPRITDFGLAVRERNLPQERGRLAVDIFVDIGQHGHGPSVARLREHGVTPEELEKRVEKHGLRVVRRQMQQEAPRELRRLGTSVREPPRRPWWRFWA
jgi:serine/threonine protein kinase